MSRRSRLVFLAVTALAFVASGSARSAMIDVTSDNTDWTVVNYPIVTVPDDPNDHQTGISEGDIVGNNTGDPAVLTNFDDNGTPGILDDGYIGFRVRVAEDKPPPGFESFPPAACTTPSSTAREDTGVAPHVWQITCVSGTHGCERREGVLLVDGGRFQIK